LTPRPIRPSCPPKAANGDLHFYKLDGDIRGRVAEIDTSKCPLYLLSGEYDYSCTPEETLAVADSVAGCEAVIMKGLGHFPMSENPDEFLKYLLPVLDRIGRGQVARRPKRGIGPRRPGRSRCWHRPALAKTPGRTQASFDLAASRASRSARSRSRFL
jgi:hypothetical protein